MYLLMYMSFMIMMRYYYNKNCSLNTTQMNRSSLRSTINLTKQSRITESSTCKTNSKIGNNNSNPSSSSNSMANISISFLKDANFPRLFNHSPMLFSFNGQPSTTKNSSMRSSIGFTSGLSSGLRTPNSSSYNSLNQLFQKDHSRKNSLFTKKSSQLTIDISKKKAQQKTSQKSQKPRSHTSSLFKHPSLSSTPSFIPTLSSLSSTPSLSSTTQKLQLLSSNTSAYDSVPKTQNIKVFVRIKPPCQNRDICIKPYIMRIDEKHVQIQNKVMAYDFVFPIQSKQEEVFERVAKPVLEGVFEGFNGTIFAYGQTGSGKTHTIFGGSTCQSQGIISRSIKYILSSTKKQHKISLSLLQIYKQQLIDLMDSSKTDLKIKQTATGVSVQNLTRSQIHNIQQALPLIDSCLKNRRVATTKLNQKSSRSHTILTIYIQCMENQGKLCLIDLAGSQKANKAGVVGENFQEMKKINYSLSCLGNVINALVTRKKSDHIPFRDSKLTRLLKDSLSGKFRTSIIVNCSSDIGTEDETASSLKFADRAKKVKITISKCSAKGKQNVEYLHKVIQQLTTDLQNTKRQLNKYKQICTDKAQTQQSEPSLDPLHTMEPCTQSAPKQKLPQSPQVTARQTIPSQRIHLDQQMKRYGKENKKINVVSLCQRQKQRANLNMNMNLALAGNLNLSNQLSSLNVSKSTVNFFGEISSPSVSSLSYRPDQGIDDLSFNFSSFHKEELVQDKNG